MPDLRCRPETDAEFMARIRKAKVAMWAASRQRVGLNYAPVITGEAESVIDWGE